MITTTAQPAKEIRYDRETRDFALILNGAIVGYARSYVEGEAALDALVYNILTHRAAQVEEAPAEPCAWCGGDGCKSAMQPAFCSDCVQSMLRGEDACPGLAEAPALNALGEPMPASPEEALARQLVHELNEYTTLGLACDARYEAKSAQVRAMGYDVGPDAQGRLCLYDAQTQRAA